MVILIDNDLSFGRNTDAYGLATADRNAIVGRLPVAVHRHRDVRPGDKTRGALRRPTHTGLPAEQNA